jgi:5-methyltetrahydropteroyltriglutamate--homocysteine methyltransferase
VQRTSPPFRADHVGSLLRSAALRDARARREAGAITAEALTEIEDREIRALVAKQESIGLKSITDGEFRRASWQTDFLRELPGIDTFLGDRKIQFQGWRAAQAVGLARQGQARRLHDAASADRAVEVRR